MTSTPDAKPHLGAGANGSRDDPAVRHVLIVDDHRVVADALAAALRSVPEVETVDTARTAGSAMALCERLRPDVVLMDVQLGHGDGLSVTADLTRRYPTIRVIVLTGYPTPSVLHRAIAAGACGLLPKDGSLTELVQALQGARREDFHIHPSLVKEILLIGAKETQTPTILTPREQQVLQALADGLDATQIARTLGITVLTSRGYIKSILGKLEAHSQLEAVVIAQRRGLLEASRPA